MQTEDVVFEGPIIAVNRGGAIVLVEVCLGGISAVSLCMTGKQDRRCYPQSSSAYFGTYMADVESKLEP